MEKRNGSSDHAPSESNDALRDIVSYALDLLGDIERCVQAQPLDERDSLTILEVVEEAQEALLAYYEAILQRLDTSRRL